jgi:hypothetical protein
LSPVHPITISTNAADRPHTLVGQTTNYVTGTLYSPTSATTSLARGNGLKVIIASTLNHHFRDNSRKATRADDRKHNAYQPASRPSKHVHKPLKYIFTPFLLSLQPHTKSRLESQFSPASAPCKNQTEFRPLTPSQFTGATHI